MKTNNKNSKIGLMDYWKKYTRLFKAERYSDANKAYKKYKSSGGTRKKKPLYKHQFGAPKIKTTRFK